MKLQKTEWMDQRSPSLADIEALAYQAYSKLPEHFRAATEGIVFLVQDFPGEDIISDLRLDTPFDLLGLFQGSNLADRESNNGTLEPTMIFLFRRAILDYWAEHKDTLGDIVEHVLVHEIGHHFGLTDEDMDKIELSYDIK